LEISHLAMATFDRPFLRSDFKRRAQSFFEFVCHACVLSVRAKPPPSKRLKDRHDGRTLGREVEGSMRDIFRRGGLLVTAVVLAIVCTGLLAQDPPHWHPTDENITVLQGAFLVGVGEKYDEQQLKPMNVGSFLTMPREMRHFARAQGETVIQAHGIGPFKVNWVNPGEVILPSAAKN
jgi:hypothetical protein